MIVINDEYMVYVRGQKTFNTRFIHLCAEKFGMDEFGARKHHDMLEKHCPSGYLFLDRAEKDGLLYNTYLACKDDFIILNNIKCYGNQGEVLENHVYVFIKAPSPIMPKGYEPIETAPEDKIVHVCWGSLDTSIHFGSAKRLLGAWYIYGQANPHENGQHCARPSGWYTG